METNAKEKTFSLEWHKGAFKTTHSVLFQMEMHTMANQDSGQRRVEGRMQHPATLVVGTPRKEDHSPDNRSLSPLGADA